MEAVLLKSSRLSTSPKETNERLTVMARVIESLGIMRRAFKSWLGPRKAPEVAPKLLGQKVEGPQRWASLGALNVYTS
jgi:hypothetical protein